MAPIKHKPLEADREIKDEMVIGPVVLQTPDLAQTLENNSMALNRQVYIKNEPVGVVKEEYIVEELDLLADKKIKDEMVIGPVILQIPDLGQTLENNSVALHRNVHIKNEPVGVVKEEYIVEELDLLADQKIKDEMVIVPVVLHIPDLAQTLKNNSMALHRNIHIKNEIVGVVKEEYLVEELDLFTDQEIKDEKVIGPVVLQTPDLAQTLENNSMSLHRNVHIKNETVGVVKEEHIVEELGLFADHTEDNDNKKKIMTHTGAKHKCNICDKSFVTKRNLNVHIRIHTGEKPYHCEYCHKPFATKTNCTRHLRTHTGEKPHKCDICNKCFIAKHILNDHIMTHTGETPYKCDICNKSFVTKRNLNVHIRTHTGEKPYNCEYCYKSFGTKAECTTHLRSHTGEKAYKCDICNKSFVAKHCLKLHMSTHTGEKPYKCDMCNKSFVTKQSLNVHIIRTHTREKPYNCKHCHKSFATKAECTTHLRSHTGEKPYKCDICNKCFVTKQILNVHNIRTHTGEKP